jgi:hypothetical protein
MNKLIIPAGMIALALYSSQAQAGSPMMDDPLPLSVRGETSGNRFTSGIGGQEAKPSYHTYRDRLGYGIVTNSPRTGGTKSK